MADATLERLIVEFEARTRNFERALKKVEGDTASSARRMEGSFKGLSTTIAGAGKTLLGAFGVGVGIGLLGQLPSMILGAADAIGSLGEQAQTAGIKVKDLIELTRVGLGEGLTQEQVVKAMGKLTDTLAEAGNKGNNLKKILDANGVSMRDAFGNVRSTADMLEVIAELTKNAANEQDRMTIATAAFGDRLGREIIPLLNQGADGLRKSREEARFLSDFITDDLVKAADEFGDSWSVAWNDFTVISQAAIFKAIEGLKGLVQKAVEFRQSLLDRMWSGSWFGESVRRQNAGQLEMLRNGGGTFAPFTTPGDISGAVGAVGTLGGSAPLGPTTKIPDLGSSATKAAKKIKEETYKMSQAVKDAADRIKKAQEEMQAGFEHLGQSGVDALTAITIRGENAVEVFKNLAMSITESAVKAALLGQGPLAGLFGTSTSGGVLGGLWKPGGATAAAAGAAGTAGGVVART